MSSLLWRLTQWEPRRRTAVAFTPASLSNLALWIDPSDTATMFQEVAGTTPVTDGSTCGYAGDKSGNAFHLTAGADDTTRPTWVSTGGFPYLNFDGSNDVLRREAGLALLGAASIFIAVRGNPAASRILFMESNASNVRADWIRSGVVATSADMLFRNQASSIWRAAGTGVTPNTFDNSDNVYGLVDDGATFTTYLDGVQVDQDAYTATGVNTTTEVGLGAGWVSTVLAASHFATRVYGLVIVKRVITAGERASLVTYLGAKMGRVL